MPGSLTLTVFSMGLLMPALWEVSERRVFQQADPHNLLYTVASPAEFSEQARAPDSDADGFGEATIANTSSCGAQLFGVETEQQHAPSSEKGSEANPVSMWRSAVFAAVAVGVATAEALAGIALLLKYLQRCRACPHPENLRSPIAGNEEQESRPGPCAPEGGESSRSSFEAENSSLRTSVKRLTAENNALKGAVHAVWRGDAIDIWDFEEQIDAASDSSAESSEMSVSSTFDDGHSSSRQSSSTFEAFSIGSREDSFVASRETGDHDAASSQHLTSSDDDAASSCHFASSDDDAASSHCPVSSDDDVASSHHPPSSDDEAASSHPVANIDDDAASFDCPTPSGNDADLTDLDVQEVRSICFSKPRGLAKACEAVHRVVWLYGEPYTPSSTSADVEDELNLPRFSAPYTPSTTSSDEAEEPKNMGRNGVDSEVESIQSQAQIELIGPCTKRKQCFSSPYASSGSGSSEPCDEEYQQDSQDHKKSWQLYRQVQEAWQNPQSPVKKNTRTSPEMAITPIQELSEHGDEEFVRDPWRLVVCQRELLMS